MLIAAEAFTLALVGSVAGVLLLVGSAIVGDAPTWPDSLGEYLLGFALGVLGVSLTGFAVLVSVALLLPRPAARVVAVALHAVMAGWVVAAGVSNQQAAILLLAALPGLVLWQLCVKDWPQGRSGPVVSGWRSPAAPVRD